LGDNRANSVDSRSSEVGLVSKKRIVGKVILRFWPFSDMQYNFKH
ncbi:S26 family signal peptidase, partial [Staphylococcus epidermidis]